MKSTVLPCSELPPIQRCPAQVRIVHNEPIVAAGVWGVLAECRDINVLGQNDACHATAGEATVVVADHHQGIAIARESRSAGMRVNVLVVTLREREYDVMTALEAGVRGYLMSGFKTPELIRCVRTVSTGAKYLCRLASRSLAERIGHKRLSEREQEVLALLEFGLSNKAIALRLGISHGTVKSHMQSILRKLAVSSRTEAVGLATRGHVPIA